MVKFGEKFLLCYIYISLLRPKDCLLFLVLREIMFLMIKPNNYFPSKEFEIVFSYPHLHLIYLY